MSWHPSTPAAADLPVYRHREQILARLADHAAIVVESPTGSGKTTQLPRILYEAGYARSGRIGVTQPRRIAAVSVSEFIRHQLEVELGEPPERAAYKMRFDDATTPETRIKVMTDGILLQEIKHDPELREYDVMLVDEAHERSLNIDFVLGLLHGVLGQRPSFRVIVSSATINPEAFSAYFSDCPIVRIDTPVHPIRMSYRPLPRAAEPDDLFELAAATVRDIEKRREAGDVLVFMSGEREIRECLNRLDALPESARWQLLPLYGRLPRAEQELVFDDFAPLRKIVVATNIAETSITIPGIRYVVDSGLAKINSYNTRTFTAALTEEPVAKASCDQRRGRAGRTGPGECYRLYSEAAYHGRPPFALEEIHRTDLAEVVLRMAELGIGHYAEFPFITHPGRERIAAAVRLLQLLGALDEREELTPVGEQMCAFPILPRHSRMVVEAIHRHPDAIEPTLIAASFLSTLSPLLLPDGHELEARAAHQSLGHPRGDFMAYLDLFAAFRSAGDPEAFCHRNYLELRTMREVVNIKEQLQGIVGELGVPVLEGLPLTPALQDSYLCAVGRGLIQFVCVATGRNRYRSVTAGSIYIHPGSSLFGREARYIVAGEVVRTSRMYARTVSPLPTALVRRISPTLLEQLHERSQRGGPAGGRSRRTQAPGQTGRRPPAAEQLQLGGASFAVAARGKRRVALIPLAEAQRLAGLLPGAQATSDVASGKRGSALARQLRASSVRGALVLAEGELMAGARLPRLLELAGTLEPRPAVATDWPDTPFDPEVGDDLQLLLRWLPRLTGVAARASARAKKRSGLGFLSLDYVDGRFRLDCKKTRESAVAESLAALERLATAAPDSSATTGRLYHQLTALL